MASIARNLIHRFKSACGYYALTVPTSHFVPGDFFCGCQSDREKRGLLTADLKSEADNILSNEFILFSHIKMVCGGEVEWCRDVIHGVEFDSSTHFSRVKINKGDVKVAWELSRFEWATKLARAYCATGDQKYLEKLNSLCRHWAQVNAPYVGVNWYCGQESSIRLINTLLCWRLLQSDVSKELCNFIEVHLVRIEASLGYAISQNNNHGTSEAAALFIGGCWLAESSRDPRVIADAKKYERLGREWLENRVEKLVFEDGGFSQYSTNYHRVLIDTLNQAEYWRQIYNRTSFSAQFMKRYRLAIDWLASLIVGSDGSVPNLGANDGARLFDFSGSAYSDFRPSVELACRLVNKASMFEADSSGAAAKWLGVGSYNKQIRLSYESRVYQDFGLVVLRNGLLTVFVRFASFSFRPSQSDCFHVDAFYDGKNVLRDGGSFSYHTQDHYWFSGVSSHNTVAFDDEDQMPRVGKFLFGNWLSMKSIGDIEITDQTVSWEGSYEDQCGNLQARKVLLEDGALVVEDRIEGSFKRAVCRWRLNDSGWRKDSGDRYVNDEGRLLLVSGAEQTDIIRESESSNYMERHELPVVHATLSKSGRICSSFHF